MEASPSAPHLPPAPQFQPDIEKIKRKLLKYGVSPTPKIVHNLRKKAIQKNNRRQNRTLKQTQNYTPLTEAEKQAISEDARFRSLKKEYREFNKAVDGMVGVPWERMERIQLRELSSGSEEFKGGGVVRRESLRELGEMFEDRKREELQWLLDDDIEVDEGWSEREGSRLVHQKRRTRTEAEAVRFLVARLSAKEIDRRDWKFSRMMKQSDLQFNEDQLLKIIGGLGAHGCWKQALSVVEWLYHDIERQHWKSRFVYTKLLAVLGKARRPKEALHVFNLMREDLHIYPDMAAYHCIAVTLGQGGLVKELMKVIQCMRQKPSKKIKNFRHKNWDPVLEPDLVVYNAVMNACVSSHQWKGAYWVFEQVRKSGLKPNGATYGLAMEVMLKSGKYEAVHEFFNKMQRSGEAPCAITYKVLVTTFWKEGKVDEAVEAVRDMECRGVVGTASVYYELACCLCNNGRWREAVLEIEKLRKLPKSRPLEVAFTGLIISSMEGGNINNCLSLFHYMKSRCSPNIGTINTMLKIYGRNDMFSKAKELFEGLGRTLDVKESRVNANAPESSPVPDEYTFGLMLEAAATALQWEYFEYVYKEMALSGFCLDQRKYGPLLVAASRAGKGYVLEHAFDAILEHGEIPHPSIFLEMVVQTAAQSDYERAVTLIGVMAHAPFQVSTDQWTELFTKNKERVGKECLENLLNALGQCSVSSEATVANLVRSLRDLCGSETRQGIVRNLGLPEEENLDGCGDSVSENVARVSFLGRDELNRDGRTMDEDDDFTALDGIISKFNVDDSDGDDDMEIGGEADDTKLDLPSADEILEMWKESRHKDGVFLQFHLQ